VADIDEAEVLASSTITEVTTPVERSYAFTRRSERVPLGVREPFSVATCSPD
jgi:hypothetical protein